MKRWLSLMAALVILFCSVSVLAESPWTCPVCGYQAEGNFCAYCGYPTGSGAPVRTTENLIRLDLDIGFEKNAVLYTFDVKLFIDDEFVAVLDHGESYQGSIAVTPGSHTISFRKANNSSVSNSRILVVEEPTKLSCVIHARMNRIEITGEHTVIIDTQTPLPGDTIYVNGDVLLEVNIEFRRNINLSKYDVELYVDDQFIATLPHGNDYQGFVSVSEGTHVITFCKSGDHQINGMARFVVGGNAAFSCRIEAKNNKVKVSNEAVR